MFFYIYKTFYNNKNTLIEFFCFCTKFIQNNKNRDNDMGDTKYKVPNLERTLNILELLREHPQGLSLSDIASKLEVSVNSVFRISMTLLERGYFTRNSNKEFRMSRKLLSLASAAASDTDLLEIAKESMRALRDETRETVLLGTLIPQEARGVTLEQVPGLHPFKFLLDVGSNLLLHVGAPGKCFLAFAPEDEQKMMFDKLKLPKFTKNTITTKRDLKKELVEVREKGYAVDRGEWMEEMHCVGAPVFDQRGYPVAAIWVTGPTTRIPESDFDRLGEIVKKHASQITEVLIAEHI